MYSMSDADHRDSDRRADRKRELISQEAAEWFARMKDPHVPLEDRRNFVRWLKQSQVHVAEYLTVANIHGDLQRAQLPLVLSDAFPSNVVALFADAGERPVASHDVTTVHRKIAAAIAVCALGTLLFFGVRTAWTERSIETELSEWKTVTLADGSELRLGPNTLLKFDVGDAQRAVTLVHGEANFKVAKDAARPFVVEAKAFAVRAVGTEFAVSHHKDELVVTVSEGLVRVAKRARSAKSSAFDDGPSELSVPIGADHQLRIVDTWPVTPSRIDVRLALAWRDKQLTFQSGDTLADAVDEFNRRNLVQLQIDPRVANLPVRSTFDASDPVAFAQTIDKTAPVAVRRIAANTLLIESE
jgi:transmembrane sensor